jgi:hypothetical protein
MAHTGTASLIPISLEAQYTLSVADGWDYLTMPFSAVIWRVTMAVGYQGTTSGNIDCVVERTDTASTTTDLWTIAATCGRIAYDATYKYLEWTWENANWTGYSSSQIYPPSGCRLNKGDTIKLNINAIDGGAVASGLKLTLWVRPFAD